MNALDYGRDNRLRLWFIDPDLAIPDGADRKKQQQEFRGAVLALAEKAERSLKRGGYCVVVVGEKVTRSFSAHPSGVVRQVLTERAPSLRLTRVIVDGIPDIRRSRRNCHATKREHVIVLRKR